MKKSVKFIGITVLLAVICISVAACASSGGANGGGGRAAQAASLIVNGSFEDGKRGWTTNAWDDVFTLDNSASADGDYSLRITDSLWGPNLHQYIAVRPNTNYVCTFQAKVNRSADEWSCLVKFAANNMDFDNSISVNPGSEEWTEYELRFNSGDKRRICLLILGNESEFYVDNFVMNVER